MRATIFHSTPISPWEGLSRARCICAGGGGRTSPESFHSFMFLPEAGGGMANACPRNLSHVSPHPRVSPTGRHDQQH